MGDLLDKKQAEIVAVSVAMATEDYEQLYKFKYSRVLHQRNIIFHQVGKT